MTRQRLRFVGALACLVALAGACGSDDSGDSTTAPTDTAAATTTAAGGGDATTVSPDTTAGGAATTASGGSSSGGEVRGVTATEIKIGGLGEATTYVGVEAGAKARFERANREGGINGRMIDYIGFKDDGKDAGRDLDQTRELIDSEGVFAVAPVITQFFLPQSSDLLAQNKVPFVGWGFMPGFCDNPYGYGFNGCLIGTKYINSALVDPVLNAVGKPMADIRVAIQSGDDITGKSGAAQYADTVEKRGAQVVYNEQNIPTDTQTTDYSPFVQEIIKSNPDVVYSSTRFSDVIGLTTALRQAGYTGPVVNFVTYVPGLLDAQPDLAAALEGVWVNSQIPPSESESPAVKQVADDLSAIGEDPFVTLGASVGYWSADVLVQQLTAAGADLTPETFQAAMQDFTYTPLEGGIGPVTFPQDQSGPTPCSALVEIKDKAYSILEPMQCYEAYPAG
jgi:ABC-type branched-subunit amino acid transport system substrate-binding protein